MVYGDLSRVATKITLDDLWNTALTRNGLRFRRTIPLLTFADWTDS